MESRRAPFHIRVLRAELLRRQEKNPRYSLRAFANSLKIHPSAMSRILALKQDLSLQASVIVLQKLNLSPGDAKLFVAAVAEDKRNRAAAILTRAIEPAFDEGPDFDPRFERIVMNASGAQLYANSVLALTQDLISVVDTEGRIIYANEAMAKRFESIPCDMIGLTWKDTPYSPEVTRKLEAQERVLIATGEEQVMEFSSGSGREHRIFERKIVPIFGRDHELRAMASAIRDVTLEKFYKRAVEHVHSSTELSVVYQCIAQAGVPLFGEACIVALAREDGRLEAVAAAQENGHACSRILETARDPEVVSSALACVGESVRTHAPATQIPSGPSAWTDELGFRAAAAIPMARKGEVAGAIVFASHDEKYELSKDELATLREFGEVAAQSIRNALHCRPH